MGMKMYWYANLLFERFYKFASCTWATNTSHVFNAEYMSTSFLKLFSHIDVILQVIFRTAGIKYICCITNRCFTKCAGFSNSINCNTHVIDPVERIENTEYIDTTFRCAIYKEANDIIRIICIPNCIGSAQ